MKYKIFGLVLNDGERDDLLNLCLEEGVPILFLELFEGKHRYLWGFNTDGIDVMRAFSSSGVRIIHGVKELREFFKTDEWIT